MIQSKKDYYHYLERDKIALGVDRSSSLLKEILAPNYIWKFQKNLRKVEYYKNCRLDFFGKLLHLFFKIKLRKISLRLGFSIPENVFGPGLAIVHYGTIIVNGNTKVGANCRIHACTNIGASGGRPEAPTIGDNVYIGPGAKIYGNIIIANNIAIGANATVNKSFTEDGIMIAGNPAVKIKNIEIKKIIKHI